MRHEKHRRPGLGVAQRDEMRLQPDDGAEVKEVCRFVEDEQIGFLEEGARESGTHAPAAGEGGEGIGECRFGEAEGCEDGARAGFEGGEGHLGC